MLIEFRLTMPNVGSWNNKWTGEDRLYSKVRNFTSKEKLALANELTEIGNFHYNFGDGWGANVSVRKVDAKEAGKLRRASKGFFGYDWMIDSIIQHRKITAEGL